MIDICFRGALLINFEKGQGQSLPLHVPANMVLML